MIQSKYKQTEQMGIKASKLAYKLKSKKKDLLINVFVPIAVLLMIGVLIYDIKKSANIVLDIILLALLAVIEVMNFVMPFVISNAQKKHFKELEKLNYDHYIVEYDNGKFKEKIYKDNKMLYANEIPVEKLVNYAEFDHYFLLLFNNFSYLVFDLNSMQNGSRLDLLNVISKYIKK